MGSVQGCVYVQGGRVGSGGGSCVPASFLIPHPEMRSASSPLLIQHLSPAPWPLQLFLQLPGEAGGS